MEKLQKEMGALLDKYGYDLQVQQNIVFVPRKKAMEEEKVAEVAEEVATEETPVEAPEEVK